MSKEQTKKYNKTYYEKLKIEHPEKIKKYSKVYKEKNRKDINNKAKIYRQRYKKEITERRKKYYIENPEKLRDLNLKKYNINSSQYSDLLLKQNNVCAICFRSETSKHTNGILWNLSIDHDHKTSKIRGLLCNNCNRGLGLFQDNLDVLKNAVLYLEGSKLLTKKQQK